MKLEEIEKIKEQIKQVKRDVDRNRGWRSTADYLALDTIPLLLDEIVHFDGNCSGCPCAIIEPCNSMCTCVVPSSSMGCKRCCRYGSLEQRQNKARKLVYATNQKEITSTVELVEVNELLPGILLSLVAVADWVY